MFFIGIFGIEQAQKELGRQSNVVCPSCGALTQLSIVKSYTFFHIFFIPTFRWNIHYYAKAACCGTVFELDHSVGQAYARGERPEIRAEHLQPLGHAADGRDFHEPGGRINCPHCGRSIDETTGSGYQFCPYCGQALKR